MRNRRRRISKRARLLIFILLVLFFGDKAVTTWDQTHQEPTPVKAPLEEGFLETIEKDESVDYVFVFPEKEAVVEEEPLFRYEDVPEYTGEPFCFVNDNIPYFTTEQMDFAKENLYAFYGNLDRLDRPTMAQANIAQSTLPTEARGDISSVVPTGFIQGNYDFISNGGWLYNRSHLMGYQLTGENANPKNLITGTRYFNVDGMYPFEHMVADYVKQNTDKSVLYRVTPIFLGEELVARGVLMEARSIGKTDDRLLEYNVFIYNVQPGIDIDYATGKNYLAP